MKVPLDYMHLVLEGEFKRKLKYILDVKNGIVSEENLKEVNSIVKKVPSQFPS